MYDSMYLHIEIYAYCNPFTENRTTSAQCQKLRISTSRPNILQKSHVKEKKCNNLHQQLALTRT